MDNVIKRYLLLEQHFGYEYLVSLESELYLAPLSDVCEPSPMAIAVYRYDHQTENGHCVYVFGGVRINNLPNTNVHRTSGILSIISNWFRQKPTGQ
jgi:hypothetical protein